MGGLLLRSPRSSSSGLACGAEEEHGERTGDVTHPSLDLRLEYLIDGALLAHACTSTGNHGDAFRETLVRDATDAATAVVVVVVAGGRARAFVLPFRSFFRNTRAHRIFRSARFAMRCDAIAS